MANNFITETANKDIEATNYAINQFLAEFLKVA